MDRLGTFDFFFDVGCFQHFDAGQRVGAGRGITALANLGATLLMMAFSRSTPIRSFVKAVSPDDVQAAFPSWGRAAHGPVEVVVDQPASIGALPVAVAQDMGSDTAYLPGLAMPNRRSASGNGQDRCPGCLCHRRCCAHPAVDRYRGARDGGPAVLMGHDDDLRDQVTAATNRIRNLQRSIHPALEWALGTDLAHPAVLA